ncbi:MAG: hypothetical protein HY860_05385 [Chlamydiales bacterium]|nr:hypothetical protein [Chlamydiales bacterium]
MTYNDISTPDDYIAWMDLSAMGMRDITSATPQDKIAQIAEVPKAQIIQLLSYQKTALESINGGALTLLQQHALSDQTDSNLNTLQAALMSHPLLQNEDPFVIQEYIAHQNTEIKQALDLPQSLPSLPSRKLQEAGSIISTKQEFVQTGAPSMGAEGPEGSSANPFANIFNNMTNSGTSNAAPASAPSVQKYNYQWIDLADAFFAAVKSGNMDAAMVIYQQLSMAINQSSPQGQQGAGGSGGANSMTQSDLGM